MASNVVKLSPTTRNVTRKERRTTRVTRALRRQGAVAGCIGSVAVVLTALSLNHLATNHNPRRGLGSHGARSRR